MPDAEQSLVHAAEELSADLVAAKRRGFRRKRSRELRAEFAELDIEAAALLDRDLVTDFEMRALTRKFRRVADLALDSMKVASGRPM